MVSSLASQLLRGVSINAPLLADRSRRRHAESYLFTSREAEQHDLHSIYSLGVTGLSKLKSLDAKFSKYDDNIFSDAARGLDRTLQSTGQNAELDRTLGSFLRDLGPYLLEAPASKTLEWLVRRFRVNEFNLDDVMALFLPYHDSPHFVKMMSIMHVGESRVWSFLAPVKTAGKPLPRSVLVDEMVKNVDLARFVMGLLPDFLTKGRAHRTLVAFTAGVTVEYLTRIKRISEDIIAIVLPAATRFFAADSNADCALGGYISLATLSRRCSLSSEALRAILMEMIKGLRYINSQQLLPLLVAVTGPQDEVDCLPESFADSLLQLPGIADALPDCLQWVGSEKLVLPLLPHLIRRASERPCSDLLESIMCSSTFPDSVVERLTTLCMEAILQSADKSDSALLNILSVAYQRHGTVFSDAYARILKAEEDMKRFRALEKILRSITLPPESTAKDGDNWILLSQAADVSTRVAAVRELLAALTAGDTREDLYTALQSRVADTSTTVIETLYGDPQVVMPALSNLSFIESISKVLAASGVSRPLMRLHFAFIATEFCDHNPDLIPAIFEHVYFPYILFTKPRQKTAMLVWKSLRNSKLADYELLKGCTDIVFSDEEGEEGSRSVEEMAMTNQAVVMKIAGNIVASNAYHLHIETFLKLLANDDPHIANATYLLFRSLLNQLSGEHQIDVAHRILMTFGLRSLDTLQDAMKDPGNIGDIMSDDSLFRGVVQKPSSSATLHRLQASVLILCPAVQRPVGVKIDWLGDIDSTPDKHGKHFVQLARAVYALANSSSSVQALSTSILRALFLNLREEALLLLAGIWSMDAHSDTDANLRVTALFHGAAFLKAQSADNGRPQSFQVILPSLLVAMQSTHSSIREAALNCVGIIAQSSTAVTSATIYAMDVVYGSSSDSIQYLEHSDFGRYISSIYSRRAHFINDSEYLGVFHQEILCKEPAESKKETGYKHRILCYTLSHTIAWPSFEARMKLLTTVKNVSNAAKLQMLLPLIRELASSEPTHSQRQKDTGLVWNNYCQTLLSALDETAAEDLNELGSTSWATLMRLTSSMFSNGISPLVRDTIVRQLCSGLFDLLASEHQVEICVALIDNAVINTNFQAFIKDALGTLLKNTALMMSLLAHFQPSGVDSSHRAAKRVKTAGDNENSPTGKQLQSMTFLIEILVAHPPTGSVELMTCAIDFLARVSHDTHSSKSDANYLIQLLMSMIESLVSSLADNATLPPSSVRMEILVELLRVSDNPQTFNQALLLIASLARASPESVMQNMMPVFTFMGSNVFHRDDAYSFRVVQKTVENIVPVMISSLKAKHSVPLDLQIACRDFLRVFTDAATHVPRHRRTGFFNHLVEVLGPEQFTTSICLLLVDKNANRVVRQKPGEVASTLSLPLAILQANFKATPFKIIEQLLHETTRLLLRITEPEATPHDAFLESPSDGDQTSLTAAKRQIQAVIIFVDLVLQRTSRRESTSDENAVRESVRILLGFSDPNHGSASPELSEILPIVLKTLGHLLRVISPVEFVSSIATLITSRNPAIESGTMNLLASRLPNISPKTRQDLSPTIISIIKHARDSLEHCQSLPTLEAYLKVLSAIAKTAVDNETVELSKTLPIVLQVAARHKSLTAEVLASIMPMSSVIGPRILPFFRDLVKLCCDVLTQNLEEQHSRTEENSHSILVTLLSSMSQFWGIDELVRLATLSLDERPVSLVRRKTMAKHIPATQLLPALFRVWSGVPSADVVCRLAFYDLFKRVVRSAPREDVHENLRGIFKLFLETFDVIGQQGNQEKEPSENASSAAFVEVVKKLNERTFEPLFRRLFDWAFNETSELSRYRRMMFCRTMTALIKMLKGLLTPYMRVVLVPLTEILNMDSWPEYSRLWFSAIELLHVSIDLDEGAFWRTDKLLTLLPALIAQVEVCPSFGVGGARHALKECLNSFAAAMDDDTLLKTLNLQLLMKTRSDDAQVRLFALECARHLWQTSGDKLTGFVTDVVTFIAECADDEHDEVAKEACRLKNTVESKCGSLDMLG